MKQRDRYTVVCALFITVFFSGTCARSAAENRLVRTYRHLLFSSRQAHQYCYDVKESFKQRFNEKTELPTAKVMGGWLTDVMRVGFPFPLSATGVVTLAHDSLEFLQSMQLFLSVSKSNGDIKKFLWELQNFVFKRITVYLSRYDPTAFQIAYTVPASSEQVVADDGQFFTIKISTVEEIENEMDWQMSQPVLHEHHEVYSLMQDDTDDADDERESGSARR